MLQKRCPRAGVLAAGLLLALVSGQAQSTSVWYSWAIDNPVGNANAAKHGGRLIGTTLHMVSGVRNVGIAIYQESSLPDAVNGLRSDYVFNLPAGHDTAAPVPVSEDAHSLYVFSMRQFDGDTEPHLAVHFLQDIVPQRVTTSPVEWELRLSPPGIPGSTAFGVAPMPGSSPSQGGSLFTVLAVTVPPGKTKAKVMSIGLPKPYGYEVTYSHEFDLPAGLPASYNGNIVAAIVKNTDRMAAYYPYRLILALHPGPGQAVRYREYRINPNVPPAMKDQYFITPVPQDDQWHTFPVNSNGDYVGIHQAVDGRVALCFLDTNNRPQLCARVGLNASTYQPLWQTPGAADLDLAAEALNTDIGANVPGFFYRFGAVVNQGANVNSFPIERIAVYNRSRTDVPGHPNTDWLSPYGETGYATGTRVHADPSLWRQASAGTVVGIVDGAPPVPNENLALYGPIWVGSTFSYSLTTDLENGIHDTYTSGLSQTVNASIGGEYEIFPGAEVGFKTEVESKWGETYGSDFERTTSTRVDNNLVVSNNTTDNDTRFETQGFLYLLKPTYDFFGYQVLRNGKVPAGADVFTEVSVVDKQMEVLGYFMNPNGRQPGVLNSYVIDLADPQDLILMNYLKSFSKITLTYQGQTLDHLHNSYSQGSQTGQELHLITRQQSSSSHEDNVADSLKVSGKAIIIEGGYSISRETTTGRTWTTGTTEESGVKNDLKLISESGAGKPFNYVDYAWDTYILNENTYWLQELLSPDPNGIGIVTTKWPPIGSPERAWNEYVKTQIVQGSAPWKVTYVITRPPLSNKSISGLRAIPGAPQLDPRLAVKLTARNVRSTGEVLQLVRAWERRQVLGGWKSRRPGRRGLIDPRLDALASSGEAADPRGLERTLAGLTPADIAALRAFLDAYARNELLAWKRAHPNRAPLIPQPEAVLSLSPKARARLAPSDAFVVPPAEQ